MRRKHGVDPPALGPGAEFDTGSLRAPKIRGNMYKGVEPQPYDLEHETASEPNRRGALPTEKTARRERKWA